MCYINFVSTPDLCLNPRDRNAWFFISSAFFSLACLSSPPSARGGCSISGIYGGSKKSSTKPTFSCRRKMRSSVSGFTACTMTTFTSRRSHGKIWAWYGRERLSTALPPRSQKQTEEEPSARFLPNCPNHRHKNHARDIFHLLSACNLSYPNQLLALALAP